MESALVLLIVAAIAAGVSGAIASSWSLRSRIYRLEDEVALIQGIVTREVKVRAGQERWRKRDEIDDKLEELVKQTAPAAPQPPVPFWKRDWPKGDR